MLICIVETINIYFFFKVNSKYKIDKLKNIKLKLKIVLVFVF